MTDAYFRRLDQNRFQPTQHMGGGWDPGELHFSPIGGLLVHAIEQHVAGHGEHLLLSKISFDILGRLAYDVCEVSVRTLRPGRTIELVEATLSIGGRTVVTARAWLLVRVDTRSVEGMSVAPLPSPDSLATRGLRTAWPGGYVASLDTRPVSDPATGRATVWLGTDVVLIADETVSALASYAALVDTANGIAVREDPNTWLFPNVDLTIHLHRQPTGRWVGLDTSVAFGPTGQGTTSSVLHDVLGPVGFAHQQLTIRPAPESESL